MTLPSHTGKGRYYLGDALIGGADVAAIYLTPEEIAAISSTTDNRPFLAQQLFEHYFHLPTISLGALGNSTGGILDVIVRRELAVQHLGSGEQYTSLYVTYFVPALALGYFTGAAKELLIGGIPPLVTVGQIR